MPGYIFSKSKDPIYSHVKSKQSNGSHQLFENLKSREITDRNAYVKHLKSKNFQNRGYFSSKFDSLKLIGSPNDEDYLDTFMNVPRQQQRRMSVCDESELLRSQSHSIIKPPSTLLNKSKSSKASIPSSSSANSSLAMLNSLRSATSEDNLYESVEMIHYLKTKKIMDRQMKTRSIQKTGHSLFDHLREEQALKMPAKLVQKRRVSDHDRPQRLQTTRSSEFYQTSNGSSPTHSSSSSGDEYETFSRNHSRQTAKYVHKDVDVTEKRFKQKVRPVPSVGSESDDDWVIPRPLFMKQLVPEKRNKTTKVTIFTCGSDESDSSIKSTGLR